MGHDGLPAPCLPAGAARFFQHRGWDVAGTCRTEEKCERLAQRGIRTHHFDPTEWDTLGCARAAGALLPALPPGVRRSGTLAPASLGPHWQPALALCAHGQRGARQPLPPCCPPQPGPLVSPPPCPRPLRSGKALESLRHATHVLSTVPPDSESGVDPVVMAHAQQLSERAEGFRWVGYISSTSGEGRRWRAGTLARYTACRAPGEGASCRLLGLAGRHLTCRPRAMRSSA